MRRSVGSERTAVVLGTGVNGLGMMRALAEGGVRTLGVYVGQEDGDLGRYSRFCRPIPVPGGLRRDGVLLDRLFSETEAEARPPVLFATSDQYVQWMSAHRETLAERFLFNLPSRSLLDRITNKDTSAADAQEGGLAVPVTRVPASPEDWVALSMGIDYPAIIKPINSFSVDFPGKNVVVESAAQLQAFAQRHPELIGQVVVQRVVRGSESNIYQCSAYVSRQGTPLRAFTMRKIHQYPPGFGITTLGRSEMNEWLAERSLEYLDHVGLVGFASIEYKRDVVDGEYYFIEANPRLPWYNSLFTKCGVNFPMIAFLDLTTPETTGPRDLGPVVQPVPDVAWLYFWNDLAGWWKERRTGEDRERFWDMVRLAAGARSFAYWSVRDPLPFLVAAIAFAKSLLGMMVRNVRGTAKP
jgi:predicted ATP-grasp superfamily ATP-dependent carboligase